MLTFVDQKTLCQTGQQSFLQMVRPSYEADPSSLLQPLMEAGLDSLGAVELRNSLASRFTTEVPATLTFDYPTIAALADYFAGSLSLQRTSQTPSRTLLPASQAQDPGKRTSAISGMSCRSAFSSLHLAFSKIGLAAKIRPPQVELYS